MKPEIASNLCDYNDAYTLVRSDIIMKGHQATQVAFKNCATSTKCITKIDGTTIDDAENLDLVIAMCNLIKSSSNYSETKESLWFQNKAANFNANITTTNNFKSSMYKTKLSENTKTNGDEGSLKNAAIAVPLNTFWRLLEMPLISCKIELKLKWTSYCVLPSAGEENANDRDNKIIFTIIDTKLSASVLTLSARDNQKLSNLLSKVFETSVCWNEYKTKSETKATTNEFGHFIESDFVGDNTLFVLVYPNWCISFNRNRKYHLA